MLNDRDIQDLKRETSSPTQQKIRLGRARLDFPTQNKTPCSAHTSFSCIEKLNQKLLGDCENCRIRLENLRTRRIINQQLSVRLTLRMLRDIEERILSELRKLKNDADVY